jgi:putative peptidoglycan lipid II flippase
MTESRGVLASAKLIALCTLLSRITGLLRDVLLAQTFGLRWVLDSFNYGFQIPNLFRRLLGEGAMAAVFVPAFAQTLEREGRDAAWKLLARTLSLLCGALAALIGVGELILLVLALAGAPSAWRLLLGLTAVMLPFMLTICVLALFSAILNCVGSFVPAALVPVLLNVAMIFSLAWLGPKLFPGRPEGQAYVLAFVVVAAGVLQVVLILPALRSSGVRLGWRWEPYHPAVRQILRLMVPVALGQGVLAFGVYLDSTICVLLTRKEGSPVMLRLGTTEVHYPLREGALSAITNAQRLYQFPLGVLVISLATAAMPAFSRLAARGDWPAWAMQVRQTIRLAVFEGILAGTMMITLPGPIVRLLFEYRSFTPEHTQRAAHVLVFYGLALWAFCAQHMILRGFYSLGDVRTPLRITAGVLPLNVAITLALVWFDSIQEAAFAISSLVTSALAVALGLSILQRRCGIQLVDRELLSALGRMLLAAVASAAVARLLVALLPALSASRILARAGEALIPLTAATATFLATAWLLRLPETELLLWRARARQAA